MAEKRNSGANLGFEDKLWAAADKLRGSMDAAEYKHVVLGLIFLKYVSDAFMERHEWLLKETANPRSDYYLKETKERYGVVEDRDEYLAKNVFWVPDKARWPNLQNNAKQPEIGRIIDDAMAAVERDNPKLKGVLPKDYARPSLKKTRLGELIDLISTIGLGDEESRQKDVLGRVYEYFLARFAEKEGKGGGEFYTPQCVVKILVEMIEPFQGRVFDPCCGSGGMFVQAARFVEAHASNNGNGKRSKARAPRSISIYGQESNYTTWRLAVMNLAIRGIDANVQWGDSFHDDKHKDLKADFVLANPPFNDSDWGGQRLREDKRWKFGVPPVGNANYAWIQHFVHHLAPNGTAGFVMANGSLTSNASGEGDIRKAIIEADMVDCVIALPTQLFYTTQIPVCLWFLTRSKDADKRRGFRQRKGETLFIDARKMGALIDRRHRDLSDDEIAEIARTYHAWRGEKGAGKYKDKAGFSKAATLEEIRAHGHALTPGRYVGAAEAEGDGIPFEEKMTELTAKLTEQMDEGKKLDAAIRKNLKGLGYGG